MCSNLILKGSLKTCSVVFQGQNVDKNRSHMFVIQLRGNICCVPYYLILPLKSSWSCSQFDVSVILYDPLYTQSYFAIQ